MPTFSPIKVTRPNAGGPLWAPGHTLNGMEVENGDTPSHDRGVIQQRCDQLNGATPTEQTKPTCDHVKGCTGDVTHLDNKGWLYCSPHVTRVRGTRPCRKLRVWELKLLRDGKTIPSYETGPKPREATSPPKVTIALGEDTLRHIAKYSELAVELYRHGAMTLHEREEARSYAVEALTAILHENPQVFDHLEKIDAIRAERKQRPK